MREIDKINNCDHDFIEESRMFGSKKATRTICSKCNLPKEVYKVGFGKRMQQ